MSGGATALAVSAAWVAAVGVIWAFIHGARLRRDRTDPDPCDCPWCDGYDDTDDDPDEFHPAGGWP